MTELSSLAKKVAGYALTIAKRYGNASAGEVHLIAAIRMYERESFDQRHPGLWRAVEAKLEQGQGTARRADELGAELIALLAGVSTDDELWKVGGELVERLESVNPGDIQQRGSLQGGGGAEVATDESVVGHENRSVDRASGSLLLTRELAASVARCTGRAIDDTFADLVLDAFHVVTQVHGQSGDDVGLDLAKALGLDAPPETRDTGFSGMISEIVGLAHPDSGRIATQVALALVDVAEWVAAHDDETSAAEADRIDAVRLSLRTMLGSRLDATSDAMAEFEKRFSELVGLSDVKAELRKRIDFLLVNKRRQARTGTAQSHRMHMAFVGNPGTGKTTVARLYAELLCNVGLLEKSEIVETDRSGLVGEYVGHTEKKTLEVISEADGGVLFVDEAYALNDRFGTGKGFGEEAVDVLVKQMEDRRERLMVIFAGYRTPMEEFLSVNPGLRSRVPVTVEFPDYAEPELCQIAERIASKRGLILHAEALRRVGTVISASRGEEGFGNARAVENLMDEVERNLTARLSDLGNLATEEERRTILMEDVPESTNSVIAPRYKQIGFMRND